MEKDGLVIQVIKILIFIVVFFLIGFLGVFLCRSIYYFALLISRPPDSVSSALVTGFFTIVVTSMTVYIGNYLIKKKELEFIHRGKKEPIYKEFIMELYRVFYDNNTQEEGELTKFLQKWQTELTIWGGSEVINSYRDWLSSIENESDFEKIKKTGVLVLAIRKELGHDNKRLDYKLFSHFILKDAEKFLQAAKNNPNISLDNFENREIKNS